MARIITSGFEIYARTRPADDASALSEVGAPDGFIVAMGGSATRVTSGQRSGAAALRLNAAGATFMEQHFKFSGGTTMNDYFVRFYLKVATAPATAALLFNGFTAAAAVCTPAVYLDNSSKVYCEFDTVNKSAALNDGEYHRVEFFWRPRVTQANRQWELRVDGTTISSGSGDSRSSGPPAELVFSASSPSDLYLDDIALNDDIGSPNSWPGDGKVLLLKPASVYNAGGWLGGSGGALTVTPITGTPPVGTASENDNTQMEANATSANGVFTTMTYADAGMAAGDVLVGGELVGNHGEDASTGTKSGYVEILAVDVWPATSGPTFDYGNNVGALSTWPSYWRWTTTGFVEPTSQPELTGFARIGIRCTTTSRVASCDFLGLIIEVAPSSGPEPYVTAGWAKEGSS